MKDVLCRRSKNQTRFADLPCVITLKEGQKVTADHPCEAKDAVQQAGYRWPEDLEIYADRRP